MADWNPTVEAADEMDDQSSSQILGNWDFPSLDPTGIIVISPPSSPEYVTMDDNDSILAAAGNTRNEYGSAEFTEISSSAVGQSRVFGRERDGSDAFPRNAVRGDVGVSGNRATTAGNVSTEKEPNPEASGGGSNNVKGGSRRLLPPTIAGSGQWGAGKWKVDGRMKEKEINEKSDSMLLKEVIEALLRNSGKGKVDGNISCVEILRSMGLRFPD